MDMKVNQNIKGFSIIEVLMAVGVLAVGMLFVAGVFPVGIYFATISAERTTAAIVSDEAFAKIKLYGVDVGHSDLKYDDCNDFNNVAFTTIDSNEFTYPSTNIEREKQYCWSAICRSVDANNPELVQVTVFVSRKTGANSEYPKVGGGTVDYPQPYNVKIKTTGISNEIEIENDADKTHINDGSRIVDNKTGAIYRVLQRYVSDDVILLDKDWTGDNSAEVWVVPPPVGGGRNPCIVVYQRVIRF